MSFENEIEDKLNAAEFPMNPDHWALMEAKLDRKKKKGFFWWIIGGFAIMMLIGGISYLGISKINGNQNEKPIVTEIVEESSVFKNDEEQTEELIGNNEMNAEIKESNQQDNSELEEDVSEKKDLKEVTNQNENEEIAQISQQDDIAENYIDDNQLKNNAQKEYRVSSNTISQNDQSQFIISNDLIDQSNQLANQVINEKSGLIGSNQFSVKESFYSSQNQIVSLATLLDFISINQTNIVDGLATFENKRAKKKHLHHFLSFEAQTGFIINKETEKQLDVHLGGAFLYELKYKKLGIETGLGYNLTKPILMNCQAVQNFGLPQELLAQCQSYQYKTHHIETPLTFKYYAVEKGRHQLNISLGVKASILVSDQLGEGFYTLESDFLAIDTSTIESTLTDQIESLEVDEPYDFRITSGLEYNYFLNEYWALRMSVGYEYGMLKTFNENSHKVNFGIGLKWRLGR